MPASPDVLRLIRGLRAASSFPVQLEVAEALAAIGTREAFEFLVSQVMEDDTTADACAQALAAAAEASKSHVLKALGNSPDCSRLVTCLPQDADESILNTLVAACKRTTNPWVVRHAATRMGRAGVERLAAVRHAIEARQSETLWAAFHIGTIDAAGPQYAAKLAQYLQPDSEQDVWLMAFTVEAAWELPEAAACLRRNLASKQSNDRVAALQIVGYWRRDEFAETALEAYVGDARAGVRCAAMEALAAIGSVPDERLAGVADREGRALAEAAETCALACQGPGASDAHWSAISAALGRLERALFAVRSWSEGTIDLLATALPHLMRAARPLLPVCLEDRHGAEALPVVDRLTGLWWGGLRYLYGQGGAHVRVSGMALAGRCVHAIAGGAPDQRYLPEGMTWKSLVDELRQVCGALSLTQLGFCLGPGGAEGPDPHAEAMVFAQSQAVTARVIWALSLPEDNAVGEALKALRASQQREHHAGRAAVRALGEAVVAAAEAAWAEYPLLALSHEASVLHDCLQGFAEPTTAVATLVPLFAEHNVQCALLGVLAYRGGSGTAPVLLKCLSSTNALVAECAEALLARAGQDALPQVLTAFRDAPDDGVRARLLEIVRCIDPACGLSLARKALDSESELLASVATRLIGQVGEPSDVPAVVERGRTGNELHMGCLMEAVAALDPLPHLALFAKGTSSPYPFVRHAATCAVACLPDDARGDVLKALGEAPSALPRRAGSFLAEVAAEDGILSSVFCGEAYPAAGSYYLGARMAVSGPRPWQWGVPAMMRNTHAAWQRWTRLVGSDDALAELWLEYAHYGEMPSGLFWKLRDLVVAKDERAAGAMELLRTLLGEFTRHATLSCFRYHGIALDTVDDKARSGVFESALQKCTRQFAGQLAAPNATASNPLGEALLVPGESYPAEDMFSLAFGYAFMEELPRALDLPRLDLPQDAPARTEAIEAEWQRLMAFEDVAFGFYVAPRLSIEDLKWYCSQRQGEQSTRWATENYLLMLATVLPQPPEVRDAAVEAVHCLYQPLLREFRGRLAAVLPEEQRHEAPAAVERHFHVCLGDYDAFWAKDAAAYGPLGTLSRTVSGMPAAADRNSGFAPYPSSFVPFGHYLEHRLSQLLREERARAQGEAAERVWMQSHAVDPATDTGNTKGQTRTPLPAGPTDSLLAMIETDEEASDPEASHGESEATAPTVVRRVVTLPVDGVPTECLDIETLAAELGTTARALRERERRGQIEFFRHEGRRYYPERDIPDLRALLTTTKQLGEMLGVSPRSIDRWRKDAPADLSPMEKVRYLAERAETAHRTGKRTPKT